MIWKKIGNIKGPQGQSIIGPSGKNGIDGINGRDGVDGIPGKDSNRVLYSILKPKDDFGQDDDWCFCETEEFYRKVNGKWKFYRSINPGLSRGGGGAGTISWSTPVNSSITLDADNTYNFGTDAVRLASFFVHQASFEQTALFEQSWGSAALPALIFDGTSADAVNAFGAGIVFDGDGNEGWLVIGTKDLSSANPSAGIYIASGKNIGAGSTSNVTIQSGNSTNAASGDVILRSGTAGTSRGAVKVENTPLAISAGTVGAPSLYLSTDTTTGLYRSAANELAIAASGVKQFAVTTDTITIGSNTATNPTIIFDCTNDGRIQWQNTQICMNFRTNGATFFDYAGSTSGITLNSNTIQNNDVRNTMGAWITATGTQTSCDLYGFFGGYYDTSTTGVSVNNVTAASGYNFFNATNVRTAATVAAGQFINEMAGSNITVTTLYGVFARAAVGTGYTATNVYGIRVNNPGAGTVTNNYGVYVANITTGTNKWGFYSVGGNNYFGGNLGIGQTAPTARLEIAAGTTAASTAPIKLTSGSLMTTAEVGAIEFLTDKIYHTITTGAARKEITLNDAALTSGKYPKITTNGRLTDGPTPLAGTKVYYVSDSSGGAVTRKLTFTDGILTAET